LLYFTINDRYAYIHADIEKVRDASFVMVKTDNSINHIFTCTKEKLSESFFINIFLPVLFFCDYFFFYMRINNKIEVDVICKKDICFEDELKEKRSQTIS
jgi:hypothetical protein